MKNLCDLIDSKHLDTLRTPLDNEVLDIKVYVGHMANLKKLGVNIKKYLNQHKGELHSPNEILADDLRFAYNLMVLGFGTSDNIWIKGVESFDAYFNVLWKEKNWPEFVETAKFMDEMGLDVGGYVKKNAVEITAYVHKLYSKMNSSNSISETYNTVNTAANLLYFNIDLSDLIYGKLDEAIKVQQMLIKNGDYIPAATLTVSMMELKWLQNTETKNILPPLRDI